MLLATWPAEASERRAALVVLLLSLIVFAAAVPWATQPLPRVWAFIPIYEAALILSDAITAVLLFGQFRITRSRAMLVLASGYLFTALTTIAHGLTFPGVFTATGLLDAGPQTTAWLYMIWHGGFPLFVVGYVLMHGRPPAAAPGASGALAILVAAAIVVAGVVGLVLIVTAGKSALPTLMSGSHYAPALIVVVSVVWLASLVALGLLYWRRRPCTVLDLWLMVVMCAWLLDIALSAMLNAGRFDLGFYAGRIYGLLAASFVLGRLLLENGKLYAQLVDVHAQERRRAVDLQQLTRRLESTNLQLEEFNAKLQEQSRFKSEFLSNMSHELRTPLNAIIGFSDLLKEGMAGDLSERQRGYAAHIFQSGHHLLALINDILDLSKIEAGKVDIRIERVDLEATLSEAITMLNVRARERDIRLLTHRANAPRLLRADRRRLKQILLNLLSNAIKFSPNGGTVSVAIHDVDRTRAANALPGFDDGMRMPLPASEFDRFVEVSVTDAGIGIGANDLPRLFAPFTQVENVLTHTAEGTGLGLMMVHRLAELHCGTVAVTSELGRGSCFTVWMPWREDAPAGAAAAMTTEAPPPRLALVVEDNDEAAALMRAQLETEGFAVRCVMSAEAALALVDQCTPDLITLDILLPGMDGWQFLARLRDTPKWEGVPVVVVSVVADRGKGFSLGAALVLPKPITREVLAKGLERLGLLPDAEREITVLVIDDDASAVELLANQLHQRQYVVLRALGGREGIELARRFRPDLIALDLEMPDVNGFDVVEALKSQPATAQIPIVVVTAKDLSPADRQQLNGHVLNIVGKTDFNHGSFVSEVQRAMAKPA